MPEYYSCDVSKDPEHVVVNSAVDYSFPLDPFQKHGISAIDQEHNVLVCAKTGSGKTLLAEYSIAHSLRKGQRVFYTTPIKSLSNQKFYDLKQLYPKVGQVGIMTGDIKFCPDADIVVMTTEILRNLLYKQGTATEHLGLTSSLSLQNLGAVVFDECHYINDRDRGKIWEETMILLPLTVQLVLLSATLDGPEHFAQWLSDLRERSCALIQTQYRVVPLTHNVFFRKQAKVIMDAKEVFEAETYREWLQYRKKSIKDQDDYKKKVQDARAGGHEGRVEGKQTAVSFIHQLNEVVGELYEKEHLPALAFMFNRAGCEKYADKIEHNLLDSSDSALAERIFDFHLRHHKEKLQTVPQYHHLRRQLIRGISFHHSGLLPVLKEAIEILFSKGLIKLMFCTETFAVGINMPTKSVIFLGLTKYDDTLDGQRILRTDEYIQMAGRAGRRGKDTIGYVYFLPEREPPTLEEMKKMMKGGKPRVESRMEFGYDFILKTMHSGSLKWLSLMKKSYWFRQWEQGQEEVRKEIRALEKKIEDVYLTDEIKSELVIRDEIEEIWRTSQNAKKKDALRRLESWKNTHIGPKWTTADTNYKLLQTLEHDKRKLERVIRENEAILSVERRMDFLTEIEFCSNQTLTVKGMGATEFNEGHPIICTELVFNKALSDLNAEELVSCLACFITESGGEEGVNNLNVPECVKISLNKIASLANTFAKKEYDIFGKDSNFWDLSTTWVEPIWRWVNKENASAICMDYGFFEGNFVRAVLRLANLVDEWIAVSTLVEDIDMLKKLEDIRPLLVRDFLVPDSLYLHL